MPVKRKARVKKEGGPVKARPVRVPAWEHPDVIEVSDAQCEAFTGHLMNSGMQLDEAMATSAQAMASIVHFAYEVHCDDPDCEECNRANSDGHWRANAHQMLDFYMDRIALHRMPMPIGGKPS